MHRIAIAASLALAACAPEPAPPAPDLETPFLPAGTFVLIEYAEGPRAAFEGSQGPGRFLQRLDPRGNPFGDFRVIAHTPDVLVYDVATGTCSIDIDRTAGCTDGSRGTWSVITP